MADREIIDPADYGGLTVVSGLAQNFQQAVNAHIISQNLQQAFIAAADPKMTATQKRLLHYVFMNYIRSTRQRTKNEEDFDQAESFLLALRVTNLWIENASRIVQESTLKTLAPKAIKDQTTLALMTKYKLECMTRILG